MYTQYNYLVDAIEDPSEHCILWPYEINHNGYGRVYLNGITQSVHRIAYELWYGTWILASLEIDHTCEIRACFNPLHLDMVTHMVNVARGKVPHSYNGAKTHCPKGHTYTEDNTYYNPKGWRTCKACHRSKVCYA